MQANTNTDNKKQQQNIDPFRTGNTLNYALEAANMKLAKKTGKTYIGSQPVNPQKFFQDFQKTQQANRQLQWLQKTAREPIPKPPLENKNTIPPFSNVAQHTSNMNKSVKNPSDVPPYSNNSAEPGQIVDKKTDLLLRVKGEPKDQQKLGKALQKSNPSYNPSPANTAKMNNALDKQQLQVIEDINPITTSNPQNLIISLKSPSSEVKGDIPVKQVQNGLNTINQTEKKTSSTNPVTNAFQPHKTPSLPNVTSSQQPFYSIMNSQVNPGNVITSNSQVQNTLPLKITPATCNANPNQTINISKDVASIQKDSQVNTNNNGNNTINNKNTFIPQHQQQNNQPIIMPNSFYSNTSTSHISQLSQINNQSSLTSKKGNLWSQYKKSFQWQQHRAIIYQKMSNKGVNSDETLDTLAAMTFSVKQPLTLNQIQKYAPKIVRLGISYQNAKQRQSQLLSQDHQLLTNSQTDRKQAGFNLQGYLGEQNYICSKDFSLCTQADFQDMLKEEEVKRIYTHFQNKTVAQFIKFYQKQHAKLAKKSQQIATTTIQAFRKKKMVEKLTADYEIEQKRNKQLEEGAAIKKILQKQQKLFRFEQKIQNRLYIGDEILPKNELFYELQEMKRIENEEQCMIRQLNALKGLLQDSKKGQPYKSVVDIVHDSAATLSDQVMSIQNELLPAFEHSFYEEE